MANTTSDKTKGIMIVGLPNSGKSQIFSNLTGRYALVANYPFSTINIKRADISTNDGNFRIYDTPGIYSLFIQSEEAISVRDKIFSGKVDIILQCIDANHLKQSLYLTAELMELRLPMVIALNAIDETTRKGVFIDAQRLSKIIGVPVVESIAIKGIGTNRLMRAIKDARVPKNIRFGDIMESSIGSIESILPDSISFKRETALLYLLNDYHIEDYVITKAGEDTSNKVKDKVEEITNKYKWNPSRLINYAYIRWIDSTYEEVVSYDKSRSTGISEKAARLCRAPFSGTIILFSIIVIVYFLIVHVADAIATFLDESVWQPIETYIKSMVTNPFWQDFLVGSYGVLSMGFAGALLTVLPILSVFFIIYSILEDVGYIPNLTVLSKRIFNKIGLSGSAILPMVLGFGCKTMATLTTRTISSYKEKYIAIFLIAFAIPCAPQIGLSISLLGKMGFLAFLITFFIIAVVEIIAGLLLNRIIKEDKKGLFVQLLPPIRLPDMRNILKKTYNRLYEFVMEALPVFIYASIVLFTLDKTGVLINLKNLLTPIVTSFMGLPTDIVEALILVMARREASVIVISNLIDKGVLDYVQTIVSVVLTTMFFPCFANIGSIVREIGAKSAVIMVVVITVTSVIIAGIVNLALRIIFG
ncbi:MAG: ferrous iron transport protein B [Thermodesulfovibrionales bacterium]|nr:ferrous iron transport protein B [Thermodesulfovibrionales bacterium]